MSQEEVFTCPICTIGEIMKIESSKKIYSCPYCLTLYHYYKKKEIYSLKRVGEKEFKKKFKELTSRFEAEKGLKQREWVNVAKGGRSDKEQKEYDKKQSLISEQNEEKELLEKIKSGDLSTIKILSDVQVMLKKGEKVYLHFDDIALLEERMPGNEKKHIDTGDFILTNKRVIFTGPIRSVSFSVSSIINIVAYSKGIGIHRNSKQKMEIFTGDIKIPWIKYYHAWYSVKTIIEGVYVN